jgi:hypothetical protein
MAAVHESPCTSYVGSQGDNYEDAQQVTDLLRPVCSPPSPPPRPDKSPWVEEDARRRQREEAGSPSRHKVANLVRTPSPSTCVCDVSRELGQLDSSASRQQMMTEAEMSPGLQAKLREVRERRERLQRRHLSPEPATVASVHSRSRSLRSSSSSSSCSMRSSMRSSSGTGSTCDHGIRLITGDEIGEEISPWRQLSPVAARDDGAAVVALRTGSAEQRQMRQQAVAEIKAHERETAELAGQLQAAWTEIAALQRSATPTVSQSVQACVVDEEAEYEAWRIRETNKGLREANKELQLANNKLRFEKAILREVTEDFRLLLQRRENDPYYMVSRLEQLG